MLGAHADSFFRKQSKERILAATPNADGRSLSWPDRGDRGTGKVVAVRGNYENPGPQTQVSAAALAGAAMIPGMGGDMIPGMGGDMIPGMGGDMIPGMGGIPSSVVTLAAVGLGLFMLTKLVR